jgi:predicted dehydrogenase
MRFALLGSHPDGLEFSCALIESGSHELVCYSTPVPASFQARFGPHARQIPDLEEILADPVIEMVVVAGSAANRPAQLRRALQSERHVACVYPPDDSPDIAHEASMLQSDARKLLFPILPNSQHPAVVEMATSLRAATAEGAMLRIEIGQQKQVVAEPSTQPLCFPAWVVLRRLGGEIAEVAGLATSQSPTECEPIAINGRFESGLLFQISMTSVAGWRIALDLNNGHIDLFMPIGPGGPAYLTRTDQGAQAHERCWSEWDPWPGLVTAFDDALDHFGKPTSLPVNSSTADERNPRTPSWKDVIRGLELDDALRRSIKYGRSVTLDYQEGSEEVGFKGTMTLVGCAMLWVLVAALIVAKWFPVLLWVIAPSLVLFLGLQAFRWIIPQRPGADEPKEPK